MSDTPHQRRSAWPLIVGFAVLAVIVAGLAYWAWRQQAQSMQRQAERSLAAVGELKADQITAWLKERQGDAEMIRFDPLLSAAVEDMLAGRDVAKATARVQASLDSFQRSYDYQDVVMTSPNGALLLRAPNTASHPVGREVKALAGRATTTRRVASSDLYLDAEGQARLELAAPVLSDVGDDSIAAVVLHVDPGRFFYPLIQHWPLPSKTGETVLVERRGDQVVYLNELRHRKGTALRLTLPANDPDLPAAQAVRGGRGVAEGVDYRGIPVVSAFQPVRGTPWFIVANEDESEVLGPIRTRGWLTAGFALLLVILAGVGTLFLWRARESQTSAEIRESEERYRALVDHAPMAIFINREDRVVLANEACLRLFGASAPDQLLGKSPFELFHPDCHPGMRDRIHQLRDKGEDVPLIEQRIVRLDGAVVDVEVAAAPFQDQGVNAIHMVVQDITERKRAEAELRANERKFRETTSPPVRRPRTRSSASTPSSSSASSTAPRSSTPPTRSSRPSPTRCRTTCARRCATSAGSRACSRSEPGTVLDEKSRHYVDTISRSVREMGVLIDDLLQFSRTGRAELKIEPVDMNATLAEALEPLRRETDDRDIEWSIGPLPASSATTPCCARCGPTSWATPSSTPAAGRRRASRWAPATATRRTKTSSGCATTA